jgi:hypothetical protein
MILILIMLFPPSCVCSQDHEQDHDQEQEDPKERGYFFGSAIAWAATHFHSPSRSTQVSVNR